MKIFLFPSSWLFKCCHFFLQFSREKIRDVRTPNYIRTLEDIIVNKLKGQPIQLVFCVLPTFGAELYNSIKKRLSVDAGVPSQCIVSKTLTKNMMSVATKVVIQVNTKLGGEPWTVRLPEELQQNSMAIGFDSAGKIKKTGVIVATLNAEYTRYCSVAFGYSRNSELNEILSENLKSKFCFRNTNLTFWGFKGFLDNWLCIIFFQGVYRTMRGLMGGHPRQ